MDNVITATSGDTQSTVLAIWLRPLVDYLERVGYDSGDVFRAGGVDAGQVFVPGVRLPLALAAPLWRRAAEVTGKPFIGLEIASDASPLQADVTTIAMMASRNLYEALQRFSRLSQIVTDSVQVTLGREEGELLVDFIVRSEVRHIMVPEAMDPALLIPLSLLGKGMINPEAITALHFARAAPAEKVKQRLQDMFPVPMQFDCEHYGMRIAWESTLRQNPYWNPSLSQLCEEQVLAELAALDDSNLVTRTRKVLQDQLASGTPQLGTVASLFCMTERQLQRKLSQQGTGFGALLVEVRMELAMRYLKDPRMTMVDIALSLGFSDQSNFVKAFKRWQGETPGRLRRRLLAADGALSDEYQQ